MKKWLIFLLSAATLCGCNTLSDPVPDDPLVPSDVMQMVQQTYPSPQNVVFTEVFKNKIWHAHLESGAEQYNLFLSSKNIKVAYKLAGSEAPDSLKNLVTASGVTGGSFSNLRKEVHLIRPSVLQYFNVFESDYQWKGQRYVVKWSSFAVQQGLRYDIEMSPALAAFPTNELSDLPDEIQTYFREKGFLFSWANVYTDAQSRKTYRVFIHKNNTEYQLIFDDDFKMVAGSDAPLYVPDTQEYPANIVDFVANANTSNAFGFQCRIASMSKCELDGVKSYVVSINDVNDSPDISQGWYMIFDENANPVFSRYYGTTKFPK